MITQTVIAFFVVAAVHLGEALQDIDQAKLPEAISALTVVSKAKALGRLKSASNGLAKDLSDTATSMADDVKVEGSLVAITAKLQELSDRIGNYQRRLKKVLEQVFNNHVKDYYQIAVGNCLKAHESQSSDLNTFQLLCNDPANSILKCMTDIEPEFSQAWDYFVSEGIRKAKSSEKSSLCFIDTKIVDLQYPGEKCVYTTQKASDCFKGIGRTGPQMAKFLFDFRL